MTLIGWCPGGRPVDAMLKTYPGTGVARIFVGPRDPLPAWGGPVLGPLVAAGVAVHLSYKTNPPSEVLPWAARKPAGLPLWLTEDHEPEQGPDAGDPTLEEFHAAWGALVPAFDGHPMREEIRLGPVYTRYWWQKVAGDRRWLPRVPVDFIGWDVYSDVGYRSPDDLLTIPRQVAVETGLPYLIAELGAKPGTGRAAWMRAMVDAAKADGALTVCWYHKDGWDLTATADQQTWQDIIEQEAAMAWSKGQPWRTVRALDRLNEQIRATYPRAVPPATDPNSWGALADGAHSTTSDHYPHYYAALGKTAVVCARDFPHAPALGLDAHALADRLRQSRDPRISYVISNGRITSPGRGWQWGTYSGSDPHDTHIHVSTVHTAAADDPRDWQIGDDDMPLSETDIDKVAGRTKQLVLSDGGMQQLFTRMLEVSRLLPKVAEALPGLDDQVLAEVKRLAAEDAQRDAALAGRVDQLAAQVADRVLAALPDSDAGPVSREDLEAALRSALGSLDGATPQS